MLFCQTVMALPELSCIVQKKKKRNNKKTRRRFLHQTEHIAALILQYISNQRQPVSVLQSKVLQTTVF